MSLFFWLLDTMIVNAYRITRILGLIQEQKEFRYELIWDLIELANDTREVQLRSCSKKETNEEIKKETQWLKVTKNFKLSNKRLAPGNHFAEWRKKREACQWCTWLANKKLLDMDHKTLYQSQLWCIACNVPLCCNSNRNCFVNFHIKDDDNK